MLVKVRFLTRLKEVTGKEEEEVVVDGRADVGMVLKKLGEEYGWRFSALLYEGDSGALASHLQILLDGLNVLTLDGLRTSLRDGSVLAIIPLVSGG